MAKTYLATRGDIADMATNTNLSAHKNNKNNPHGVTAAQVGARPSTWLPTPSEIGAAACDQPITFSVNDGILEVTY